MVVVEGVEDGTAGRGWGRPGSGWGLALLLWWWLVWLLLLLWLPLPFFAACVSLVWLGELLPVGEAAEVADGEVAVVVGDVSTAFFGGLLAVPLLLRLLLLLLLLVLLLLLLLSRVPASSLTPSEASLVW